MNSSTLRRLAADHASLRKTDLPPHYLFPSSDQGDYVPDDLTQLTVLLTGPQSTPYSQGLWKLSLKIPENYPNAPPKAAFRTRIWHPNVEESTGSVCVDTLKKDWESKLTLRDVLITISCLLIQPNPDSALNSTAGHLLQEDYEAFARQARLMTSIHAGIPKDMEDAVMEAKTRGDSKDQKPHSGSEGRPSLKSKSVSASSVVMKKKLPQRLVSTSSAPPSGAITAHGEASEDEDDEASASKENDPAHSPITLLYPSPRRSNFPKRPLSDLPCPTEEEVENCANASQQNIINDVATASSNIELDNRHQGSQLTERNELVNFTSRGGRDTKGGDSVESTSSDSADRPPKRVCSDEAKENASRDLVDSKAQQSLPKPNPIVAKTQGNMRKASAPASLGGKTGKARIGLRRL